MLPDFGFWNNFFWSLTVCSTTGFIIKPVLAKGCKFEGNKRAINQNWFIFASLHYEDQVSPSTRCYLENLCSVYQLCQLFPGRQHIHKTICVCKHQRATPAEYICPPLKWHCTSALSTDMKSKCFNHASQRSYLVIHWTHPSIFYFPFLKNRYFNVILWNNVQSTGIKYSHSPSFLFLAMQGWLKHAKL